MTVRKNKPTQNQDKTKNQTQGQHMLPLSELTTPMKEKKVKTKSDSSSAQPATRLMKMVAAKAPNQGSMKKVFSEEEIMEIMLKKQYGLSVEDKDKVALKERYRQIKLKVREMEKENQSRVIFFPSLTNGVGWYKAMDFSALYYAYRLADRMGRSARVMRDNDHFLKAHYMVSVTNMERMIEQFSQMEEPRLDITEDGVYIFTLKQPVSDDEKGMLYRTEETRRERMHNILKPRNMDPATFAAILTVDRQILPRVRKLDHHYYLSTGQAMMRCVHQMLTVYAWLNDGVADKKQAGQELVKLADELMAGVTLLSEIRVWPYDVAAVMGENIAQLKRLVAKDFGIKIGKE